MASTISQGLLNSLPDGILLLNSAWQIVVVNEQAVLYLQQTSDALIGQSIGSVLPAAYQLIKRYEQPVTARTEVTISEQPFEIRVSPLEDESEHVDGRLVMLRDLSARRQTEDVLFANERRYRALFEDSHDAILIVDMDRTILIANQRASELLGCPLEDILLSSTDRFTLPEDSDVIAEEMARLLAGERTPLEKRTLRRADGTLFPAEIMKTLVRTVQGDPMHLQIIVRDITQRVEAEAALQRRYEQIAMLRHIDDEVNNSLNIENVLRVAINAAMVQSGADAGFIAVLEQEQMAVVLVAGAFDEAWKGTILTYDQNMIGQVLLNQEPEMVLDVRENPDHTACLQETRAAILLPLVSQERLVGLINLETIREDVPFTQELFDVLQLLAGRVAVAIENARLYAYVREQLAETQHLYHQKSRLEAMKTEMLRIASHDLKNPLGIITSYLDMLQHESESFETYQQQILDEMGKATQRMWQILRDILSTERIEQRASEDYITSVNLSRVVRRVIQDYMTQAEKKSQSITDQIQAVPEVLVRGDEMQLYQAISNLVGNAIKYTPAGGTIQIRLVAKEKQAQFEVEDNGYGIPENRQSRLFEPFYRAKVDGTEDVEGTGLGLHLVKNVIERHNGQLQFRSVYGEGSVFGFRVPVITETDPVPTKQT